MNLTGSSTNDLYWVLHTKLDQRRNTNIGKCKSFRYYQWNWRLPK